ncbi:MAG: hypothetical protein Q4B50_06120 [Bacillota bacterium]|nr:hypothetical protein [Bacillota bacterium]
MMTLVFAFVPAAALQQTIPDKEAFAHQHHKESLPNAAADRDTCPMANSATVMELFRPLGNDPIGLNGIVVGISGQLFLSMTPQMNFLDVEDRLFKEHPQTIKIQPFPVGQSLRQRPQVASGEQKSFRPATIQSHCSVSG